MANSFIDQGLFQKALQGALNRNPQADAQAMLALQDRHTPAAPGESITSRQRGHFINTSTGQVTYPGDPQGVFVEQGGSQMVSQGGGPEGGGMATAGLIADAFRGGDLAGLLGAGANLQQEQRLAGLAAQDEQMMPLMMQLQQAQAYGNLMQTPGMEGAEAREMTGLPQLRQQQAESPQQQPGLMQTLGLLKQLRDYGQRQQSPTRASPPRAFDNYNYPGMH